MNKITIYIIFIVFFSSCHMVSYNYNLLEMSEREIIKSGEEEFEVYYKISKNILAKKLYGKFMVIDKLTKDTLKFDLLINKSVNDAVQTEFIKKIKFNKHDTLIFIVKGYKTKQFICIKK